ncbi:MFS transporter [Sinorhizobium meliloti]|nr:MFS transporter [Sinorhizobium meliloti]
MKPQNSYRGLSKIPGLFSLIIAATLFRLAGRMFVLTLALFALKQFSSPALAGWLTFAAIFPGLIASPLAGVLLDHVGPTTAIRIDMIASTIFVAAISLAAMGSFSSLPVLFFLVTLFSLAGPLGAAGARTLLPRLVSPGALDRANALDTAAYAIVDVVGPAMAGIIVAWLGPEATMLIIAAASGGAAVCMSGVQRLPGLASSRTSFLRQAIEGIYLLAQQPTLRALAVSQSLYQMTWGALNVAVPVFVGNHYSVATGSSVVGLLWALVGITGGFGALLAGHLCTTGRERHIMTAGMVVTAFAMWPIAAEFGLAGLILGLMLAGMMSGPIDVALLTLRQRRTDAQLLGRVMSMSISLNMAGFPLGSAIAGTLISESLSATFIFAGVTSLVAMIATLSLRSDPPEPNRSWR